ncbi:11725_t:CDS:2 [Diversispora eburnea]|uniref:11725_t:CDS:1 n=1 Tax=Diversispora eburnea TaxID=1213867 RepID=A0A9N8ZQW6_9GLOM|nr:11725_t:CDS:2 [Diversispora eburnea]
MTVAFLSQTVALGGIIGLVKAGSTVSLAAGLTFGSLAQKFQKCWSSFDGKFMPAGLVTILSLLSAARYGYIYYDTS